MELWDLYTRDRRPAGKIHRRGDPIPDRYYHIAVHVWIVNGKGEYLMSQRSADRPKFPLYWETVGGSAVTGEDSLTAALREAKEEVGVDLDPAQGRLVGSLCREQYHDFADLWLFRFDGEADLSNATTKEVAQIKWMTRGQIKALAETDKWVHNLDYFFDENIFKE